MRFIIGVFSVLLIIGCATADSIRSIDDIDVSKKEGACVRQCIGIYSSCVGQASQANATAHEVDALKACKSAYRVCTTTCADVR